jgi:hypothetical protein
MKTIRKTKINKYLLIIILTALTTSCQEDFLDTKVDTNLTDINVESDYRVLSILA